MYELKEKKKETSTRERERPKSESDSELESDRPLPNVPGRLFPTLAHTAPANTESPPFTCLSIPPPHPSRPRPAPSPIGLSQTSRRLRAHRGLVHGMVHSSPITVHDVCLHPPTHGYTLPASIRDHPSIDIIHSTARLPSPISSRVSAPHHLVVDQHCAQQTNHQQTSSPHLFPPTPTF